MILIQKIKKQLKLKAKIKIIKLSLAIKLYAKRIHFHHCKNSPKQKNENSIKDREIESRKFSNLLQLLSGRGKAGESLHLQK